MFASPWAKAIGALFGAASIGALLGGGFAVYHYITTNAQAAQVAKDAPVVAKAQVAAGQAGVDAKAVVAQDHLTITVQQASSQAQEGKNAIAMDVDGQTVIVPADADRDWRRALERMRPVAQTPAGDGEDHGRPVQGPPSR